MRDKQRERVGQEKERKSEWEMVGPIGEKLLYLLLTTSSKFRTLTLFSCNKFLPWSITDL